MRLHARRLPFAAKERLQRGEERAVAAAWRLHHLGCVRRATALPSPHFKLTLSAPPPAGCDGPTIEDCHSDSAGYRVPLALALSQHPLGMPSSAGFNITTMGTLETGPPYVPRQWLKHEGHPGWQINTIDNILVQSLATSKQLPDLITIHLGTNDCDARVNVSTMTTRMNSLLSNIQVHASKAQVFLADVVATGLRPDMEACIVAFNKLVPGIVSAWKAKGLAISYVKVFDAMQPGCGASASASEHDLCGGHQIHPTSAGYPRMASAFALSILRNFNKDGLSEAS